MIHYAVALQSLNISPEQLYINWYLPTFPSSPAGVSPAPSFSVTAAKLPRAMAGHPGLHGQVPPTWTTLTSW